MIALTDREQATVLELIDAVVGPYEDLPPVGETDAVSAFAAMLAAAPAPNRLLLRALLRVAMRTPGGTSGLVARLAACCYYGDVEVMRRLGFDAAAITARGAAARRRVRVPDLPVTR